MTSISFATDFIHKTVMRKRTDRTNENIKGSKWLKRLGCVSLAGAFINSRDKKQTRRLLPPTFNSRDCRKTLKKYPTIRCLCTPLSRPIRLFLLVKSILQCMPDILLTPQNLNTVTKNTKQPAAIVYIRAKLELSLGSSKLAKRGNLT